ncbi:MAG: CDP-alcohol phosphatidyltransferase family protein [Ruminococcaceae bacterium]|nr:CDP-alcohol phosphatidyltransferase family protein [Oscillospiraceae bacterium]
MATKRDTASDIITIPNILSFIRLCLVPLIVWLYCGKEDYTWAGIMLIISGITDIVDGFLARRFNWISDFGKILDPIADKLTQAAMLICLILRYPLILVPFGLMFVKELFMTVSGLLVIKRTGDVYSARWHGKVATCLLYFMMILHVFWTDIPEIWSNLTIIACAVMIAVSFWQYGKDNIKILQQHEKNKNNQ